MSNITRELNSQVVLTMHIKLLQLQRQGLMNVSFEELKATLDLFRWNGKQSQIVNELVDDVLSITKDEVLAYLRNKAIVEGSSLKLTDFDDLIGGTNE